MELHLTRTRVLTAVALLGLSTWAVQAANSDNVAGVVTGASTYTPGQTYMVSLSTTYTTKPLAVGFQVRIQDGNANDLPWTYATSTGNLAGEPLVGSSVQPFEFFFIAVPSSPIANTFTFAVPANVDQQTARITVTVLGNTHTGAEYSELANVLVVNPPPPPTFTSLTPTSPELTQGTVANIANTVIAGGNFTVAATVAAANATTLKASGFWVFPAAFDQGSGVWREKYPATNALTYRANSPLTFDSDKTVIGFFETPPIGAFQWTKVDNTAGVNAPTNPGTEADGVRTFTWTVPGNLVNKGTPEADRVYYLGIGAMETSGGQGMQGWVVRVNPVNQKPVFPNAAVSLAGAIEDTDFPITYDALKTAAGVTDADNTGGNIDPLSFRIESFTGTLTKGGNAVIGGATLVGTGESLVWRPALDANGPVNAFVISAYDGTDFSAGTAQVQIGTAAVNDPPVCTAIPVVTGTAAYGQTLTAAPGTWNDLKDGGAAPSIFAYQWKRASDANGTQNVVTVGGNASTYVLTGQDIGSYVGVTVTATDSGIGTGTPQSASASSSSWQLVSKGALTITGLTANGKVYDGASTATLAGTAALAGVVPGDTVTLGGTVTATFDTKNIGTNKPVTVTGYTISGADATNYTLSQPAGLTANITAKPLTITGLTANNKTYDGITAATLAGTPALATVEAGDTVTLGGTAAATFDTKNVGDNKPVAVTGYSISGASAGNYTLSQPAGLTAKITPATLTVTADAKSRLYGAADPAFTYAVTGFVNGETAAVLTGAPALSTTAVANSPVTSTYPINIVQGTLAANNGNYTFTLVPGVLTVNKAPLGIKAGDAARSYSDNNPVFTVTYTGFIAGESATNLTTPPALTTDAKDAPPRSVPGEYDITASGAVATNYSISYTKGKLTITNAAPQITNATVARSIPENTAADTNVDAALSADDIDAGDTKTWSISDTTDTFRIDSATGQIKVKTSANLDYETKTSFTVTVRVTDMFGAQDSKPVTIAVTNVNEKPTASVGTNSATNRQIVVSLATDGYVTPFTLPAGTDPEHDPLTFAKVGELVREGGNPANEILTVNQNGSCTFNAGSVKGGPDPGISYTFQFKVNDGQLDSDPVTYYLKLINNEPPAASSPLPASANPAGNEGVQQSFSITFSDVGHAPQNDGITSIVWTRSIDGAVPTVIKTDNFTGLAAQTSAYSFTPDYMTSNKGHDAVFTLVATATDGGNVTASHTWALTVNDVNQPPTFTKGGNQSVDEDPPALVSVPGWATQMSVGNEDPAGQNLIGFTVTNNNPNLFVPQHQPAIGLDGTLTYRPALNAFGTATVTVTLRDDAGGNDTSAPQTFTITVNPVNDPPTLNAIQSPVVIPESSPQQTINLTGITIGPANEAPQTLSVTATSSNPAVIPNPTVSYTSPNATGTLTYTPVPFAFGTAVITVTVNDGQAQNNIVTRQFTVDVTPVNDAPAARPLTYNWTGVGASAVITLTGTDADLPWDLAEALTFQITTQPTHGTLELVANSYSEDRPNGSATIAYRYTPTQLQRDTFQFTVTDKLGAVSVPAATVEITVGPPWYPLVTWQAPNETWYEIEIYKAGVAEPVLGPYSIQAGTDGFVKMTPREYIRAGSSGLTPGNYNYRYRSFDVTHGLFGNWGNVTPIAPVQYNLPGAPTTAGVAPNPGNTGANFTFTIRAPDAQGYELTIGGPNGYHQVFTEYFAPKADGNLILNEEVTRELTLTTPGTYQWSVRGFNPLGPSPAKLGANLVVQGAQVAAQPPGKPGLVSPTNNTVLTFGANGTVFQWSPVANAEGYVLTVADLSTGIMPYAYQDVGNVTQVSDVVLSPGSYMWFVVAYGSGGTKFTWSDSWNFSMVQSLTKPVITSAVQNGSNGLTIGWVGGAPARVNVQLYYLGAPGWVNLNGLAVTQTAPGSGTVSFGTQTLADGYNFVYVQGILANGQAGEISQLFYFVKQ